MTPDEARMNLRDLELREFAYNHAAGMLYFALRAEFAEKR